MRIVTSLISCLLALAGCDDKPSVTTIHHSSANGVDTLFSKSTLKEGVARFECFASETGQCHYRVYTEHCPTPAPGGNLAKDRVPEGRTILPHRSARTAPQCGFPRPTGRRR